MSWLALLLTLASLGGRPGEAAVRKYCAHAATAKQEQQCKVVKQKTKKKTKKPVGKIKPREDARPTTPGAQRDPDAPPGQGDEPSVTPTPTATPNPGATPTPTATPDPIMYPSRTGVDLSEWVIRSSYRTLATGRVVFNAANLGEDDHNLSVRGAGNEYGKVDVAPGDTGSLVLQLTPGTYTLYCSLIGHEEQGMNTEISVR